jgi:O-antigen ligase
VHAAHSIYFQVLGEQGFPGLALFLLIGVLTWLDARKLVRIGQSDRLNFGWAEDLGKMVQVSMVGFATGGAFLSLTYWDMPYNVMVMVGCAVHLTQREVSRRKAAQVRPGEPASFRRPTLPAS